ncbi:MAG: 23S rRNA (guanosine(2251)-2'-O)-methyltransferase RlmB [Peptostreptococcaceae bacterium]|nr:23S rRNA (guanosine(2251)-2'-O)-methyltransferase RlmB [Peptostreptococcaceae bacterium]
MQIEGRNAILEALKKHRSIDILYVRKGDMDGSLSKIIAKAKGSKIIIKTVDKAKLDQMSKSGHHQGVIALANDYRYYGLEEILGSFERGKGFFLILDEIEDPHNFGAIIRTAEAAGVDAIIIPKRRAVQVNQTVEKTSAGATSHMKIVRVSNLVQTIELMKQNNIWIYSLDMSGEIYDKMDFSGNVALVVGNEGKGISRLVKEAGDFVVRIPMKGKIDSLNASVAASVLMYEVVRQRGLF